MKFKTTRKYIMENYNTVLSVGYCDLQYLLRWENPIAYTSGTYGWNADIYNIGGVAIVTGYRPFGRHVDHDKIAAVEAEARKIVETVKYDEQQEALKTLILDFIASV